ncbi:hypothetical protein RJ639_032875 [Escallonia herrerae]|uniref:Fe2OG dioxygenase domain-containing protein n=1 Tax=Escallonia herrerae TaxID=1293975 RepID=A0AA88XBT5_9ASTE|nr:hypothetical protein RJ639_032875 [Escallonia herrerae]
MSQYDVESYPPLFRQPSIPFAISGVDPIEPTKQVLDSDPLPTIDLQSINHEQLSDACRDWGIFRLVNHGIPVTLLNHLHDHASKTFNLGFESKQALFTSPIAYFWGTPALTPAGVALQRGPHAQSFNWVEGLNVPLSLLSLFKAEDSLLQSLRLLLEEYGNHQSRLARTIFEAMAENLKMSAEQSEGYLSPSTGLLRLYRYPRACSSLANQAWGMDVHTDSSVLSILYQHEVEGLQINRGDDTWLDVKPIPNTLVVHLGDMMQIFGAVKLQNISCLLQLRIQAPVQQTTKICRSKVICDDSYKSVKHRVKLDKNKERISIGYFVFPDENCVIHSSRYKPFTYADFRAQVQQDLKTIGFKVGLPKFRLAE